MDYSPAPECGGIRVFGGLNSHRHGKNTRIDSPYILSAPQIGLSFRDGGTPSSEDLSFRRKEDASAAPFPFKNRLKHGDRSPAGSQTATRSIHHDDRETSTLPTPILRRSQIPFRTAFPRTASARNKSSKSGSLSDAIARPQLHSRSLRSSP